MDSTKPTIARAQDRPVSILVVEDDHDLLEAFTMTLRICGYDVVDADSGEAAIAATENCARALDIVLTDVVLPGMSGIELVRRLTRQRPGLKALFMSGYPGYVLREHGIEDDGEIFLHKPFTIELLEAKIREQLDAHVAAAPPGEGGGANRAG